MLKHLFLVSVILCITACSSVDERMSHTFTHSQWQLITIDGQNVQAHGAQISFIDALQMNGFSGCNPFFGRAAIKNETLQLSQVGRSYKACESALTSTENALLTTLSDTPRITLGNDTLTLNGAHKLVFTRTHSLNNQ